MKKHLPFAAISLLLMGSTAYFYTKFSEKFDQIEEYAKMTLESSSIPQPQPLLPNEIRRGPSYPTELCSRLKHTPFADDQGIIVSVKKIDIPDIHCPYNASLVKSDKGFYLFYRYDIDENTPKYNQSYQYSSNIGAVLLDGDFSLLSQPVKIETKSYLVQDPRAFTKAGELFLAYNDVEDNRIHSRQMRLAKLDESLKIEWVKNLEMNLQPQEKNWSPFSYQDKNGDEQIYFEYSLNPHKIIKIKDSFDNCIEQPIFENRFAYQNLPWLNCFGILRGGTPAIFVDGQYLAFFHSSFKEEKKKWYVMGAYTFEDKPPFRITAMSTAPIMFKGIYDSFVEKQTNPKLRCIFPSGIALEKKNDKEYIHVSCGENDCAVKIITFDKAALINSLTTISTPHSLAQ